ncbi:MAG: YfiR family protein [Chitinophagaceae bacterium]|nr:MAG: YfiR family protein [Chitinophagaceae bacterium]
MASAQTQVANNVKAVFLYNFSKFVTWPTVSPSNGHFVIGILGSNPFGNYLEQVVEGETVDGQKIDIQYYNDVSEIKSCHILYITKSNAIDVAKSLAGRTVLTVSDGDDFARSGGIIRFMVENNKIRLRINQRHAKAAGLQISSKLLRVADVIE